MRTRVLDQSRALGVAAVRLRFDAFAVRWEGRPRIVTASVMEDEWTVVLVVAWRAVSRRFPAGVNCKGRAHVEATACERLRERLRGPLLFRTVVGPQPVPMPMSIAVSQARRVVVASAAPCSRADESCQCLALPLWG